MQKTNEFGVLDIVGWVSSTQMKIMIVILFTSLMFVACNSTKQPTQPLSSLDDRIQTEKKTQQHSRGTEPLSIRTQSIANQLAEMIKNNSISQTSVKELFNSDPIASLALQRNWATIIAKGDNPAVKQLTMLYVLNVNLLEPVPIKKIKTETFKQMNLLEFAAEMVNFNSNIASGNTKLEELNILVNNNITTSMEYQRTLATKDFSQNLKLILMLSLSRNVEELELI